MTTACRPLLKQVTGDGTGHTELGLGSGLSSATGWAVTAGLGSTWSLKAGFSEELLTCSEMRTPDLLNLAHEKRRPGTHCQGRPKQALPR